MDVPSPESCSPGGSSGGGYRFSNLRGIRWRINLGILPGSPSASIDDLRRVTADSRRRKGCSLWIHCPPFSCMYILDVGRCYVSLRRHLLIDPHFTKDGSRSPDLSMENPLSQNPDSMWGRFFRNAELEKIVDQDLSRLYLDDGRYFQTPVCQAMLRRILLVWCLRHLDCGYRQGMHELLAPLVYVLHVDLDYLSQVQAHYEDYFKDEFDGSDSDLISKYKLKAKSCFVGTNSDDLYHGNGPKFNRLGEFDLETRNMILLSDAYGVEGELGVVLSERFMEHDAYCMFDGLMSGAHGAVAMAEFYLSSPAIGSNTGLPPVIEASSALYYLLSTVDSSLHGHLVELGVEPQYFALRWLRVLFIREFSLNDLLVVWDELFCSPNYSYITGDEYSLLCSPRGTLILAMAVSMLLHVRSSLLATENATSCLQRLLNFPREIYVKKLIDKARACQALAMEVIVSSSSHSNSTKNRSAAVSTACSLSPRTPIRILPDSYWEEKWRVIHNEKTLENNDSIKSGKINEVLNEVIGLPRTESDPSSIEDSRQEAWLFVRHSLLDDLSQGVECTGEVTCQSTENPSISSMTTGPSSQLNDPEIELEKSSVTTKTFIGDNDDTNIHVEECNNGNDNGEPKESEMEVEIVKAQSSIDADIRGISKGKVKKSASGKLQWLWSFGIRSFKEDSMEKETTGETLISSNVDNDDVCHIKPELASFEDNMMSNMKNLGQSMLDNIQVIESIFGEHQGQAGDNLDGKGQAAAMASLKELRKIASILSGMYASTETMEDINSKHEQTDVRVERTQVDGSVGTEKDRWAEKGHGG
ncbi:hypothetical protein AXF42_Ash002779 [Apostasia shenzhenica]|uniref:Rab-GAP TBC domain-containing protein n=1 Tax=Apostasia shenzhenica TaxID=1088818 RepID=A0A2I0A7A3_9ASPA|nr:hypothetical protein AXF42_Ash002779 [Apostasia shenzhenica]